MKYDDEHNTITPRHHQSWQTQQNIAEDKPRQRNTTHHKLHHINTSHCHATQHRPSRGNATLRNTRAANPMPRRTRPAQHDTLENTGEMNTAEEHISNTQYMD